MAEKTEEPSPFEVLNEMESAINDLVGAALGDLIDEDPIGGYIADSNAYGWHFDTCELNGVIFSYDTVRRLWCQRVLVHYWLAAEDDDDSDRLIPYSSLQGTLVLIFAEDGTQRIEDITVKDPLADEEPPDLNDLDDLEEPDDEDEEPDNSALGNNEDWQH